jgi:hypothetical protein
VTYPKRQPSTSIEVGDLLAVRRSGNDMLYVTPATRDAIIAAMTFLAVLYDGANDDETKIRIRRVINHLSNMLYGFPE